MPISACRRRFSSISGTASSGSAGHGQGPATARSSPIRAPEDVRPRAFDVFEAVRDGLSARPEPGQQRDVELYDGAHCEWPPAARIGRGQS